MAIIVFSMIIIIQLAYNPLPWLYDVVTCQLQFWGTWPRSCTCYFGIASETVPMLVWLTMTIIMLVWLTIAIIMLVWLTVAILMLVWQTMTLYLVWLTMAIYLVWLTMTLYLVWMTMALYLVWLTTDWYLVWLTMILYLVWLTMTLSLVWLTMTLYLVWLTIDWYLVWLTMGLLVRSGMFVEQTWFKTQNYQPLPLWRGKRWPQQVHFFYRCHAMLCFKSDLLCVLKNSIYFLLISLIPFEPTLGMKFPKQKTETNMDIRRRTRRTRRKRERKKHLSQFSPQETSLVISLNSVTKAISLVWLSD